MYVRRTKPQDGSSFIECEQNLFFSACTFQENTPHMSVFRTSNSNHKRKGGGVQLPTIALSRAASRSPP